jgi:hypothetical protein
MSEQMRCGVRCAFAGWVPWGTPAMGVSGRTTPRAPRTASPRPARRTPHG